MLERNKSVIRALVDEVIHGGRLDRVADLFSPDYAVHDPSNPSRPGGLEGARAFVAMLHGGLSGVRYDVEDLVADGDLVAYRFTLRGTHSGAFMGVPPTGRSLAVSGMDMFRLKDGRIVESWVVADALGMLQQLGVLPPPGPGPKPPA